MPHRGQPADQPAFPADAPVQYGPVEVGAQQTDVDVILPKKGEKREQQIYEQKLGFFRVAATQSKQRQDDDVIVNAHVTALASSMGFHSPSRY